MVKLPELSTDEINGIDSCDIHVSNEVVIAAHTQGWEAHKQANKVRWKFSNSQTYTTSSDQCLNGTRDEAEGDSHRYKYLIVELVSQFPSGYWWSQQVCRTVTGNNPCLHR